MIAPVATRALIFDMDGTLLDSEPMHFECARGLFAEDGLEFTLAHNAEFIGQSSEKVMEQLVARHRLPRTAREYIALYEERIVQVMAQASQATDGVHELIAEARKRRLALGVASNSSEQLVRATLTGLGLIGEFGAIVGGDMVPHGKPAPDVYLEAARRLDRGLPVDDASGGDDGEHQRNHHRDRDHRRAAGLHRGDHAHRPGLVIAHRQRTLP